MSDGQHAATGRDSFPAGVRRLCNELTWRGLDAAGSDIGAAHDYWFGQVYAHSKRPLVLVDRYTNRGNVGSAVFFDALWAFTATGATYLGRCRSVPSPVYVVKPTNPAGAACVVPWYYEGALKVGEYKTSAALLQVRPYAITRLTPHGYNPEFGVKTGLRGMHVHSCSGKDLPDGTPVGDASAGCIVVYRYRKLRDFVRQVASTYAGSADLMVRERASWKSDFAPEPGAVDDADHLLADGDDGSSDRYHITNHNA